VLLAGRALEALLPDYTERLGFDTDLWLPHLADGLDALELLVRELGFDLEYARLINIGNPSPRLVATAARHDDGYKVALGILAGGYHLYAEPLDQRACPVQWDAQPLQASSYEDLLVMLALRIQRKQQLQMVNVADAAVILRGADSLDFALIKHLSRQYNLDLPLGILLAQTDARWPGLVPAPLHGLMSGVPSIHRLLTRRALQVRDEDPARQWERTAFEVTEIYRHRPSSGWRYAVRSVFAKKVSNWNGRWQNKIRRRLRMPLLLQTDGANQSLFLCGATNGEVAASLPDCVAKEPAARWGDSTGEEIRHAAERLITLLPAGNHHCWQLRASY
jgi:hypothetical protein